MTTETLTLSAFLLARIDEDRRELWCGLNAHDSSASASRPDCWEDAADCDFRQKREWAAKQAIVGLDVYYERASHDQRAVVHDALRALASVYADHPDYCAEWSS